MANGGSNFGEFIGGFAVGGILNIVAGVVAFAILGTLIGASKK
jgi:hypothetical protein